MTSAVVPVAAVRTLPFVMFLGIVAITLALTFYAARRNKTTTDFFSAGRRISSWQNGFAVSGEFTSASSFLGITGLIFLVGFDGFLYSVGLMLGMLGLLLILAERMRNLGKYTMTDVLAYRLQKRPARAAAALGTLATISIYLIAQLVGAGAVVAALVGIDANVAIIISGIVMLLYVAIGGMLATTWVLILKTGVLLAVTAVLTVLVLERVGFDAAELVDTATAQSGLGDAYGAPGVLFSPVDTISLCIALTLGTMGLPHLLMRFLTVPDKQAARKSLGWTVLVAGSFWLMLPILGLGARAYLGPEQVVRTGGGGNLSVAVLAEELGGGPGTVGGDLLLAIVAATAFAVIVGFVAGVIIAASGAVAHDVWFGVIRHGRGSEHEELVVARLSTVAIAALAVIVAILAKGVNLAFLGGLVFAVSGAGSFPPLILSLTWRRFTTTGAVVGVLTGVISSVVLIVLSEPVWPGPDSEGSPSPLTQPGIISIPLGFLGCWLGSILSRERGTEATFEEMRVRSATGLGAEAVSPPAEAAPPPAAAAASRS